MISGMQSGKNAHARNHSAVQTDNNPANPIRIIIDKSIKAKIIKGNRISLRADRERPAPFVKDPKLHPVDMSSPTANQLSRPKAMSNSRVLGQTLNFSASAESPQSTSAKRLPSPAAFHKRGFDINKLRDMRIQKTRKKYSIMMGKVCQSFKKMFDELNHISSTGFSILKIYGVTEFHREDRSFDMGRCIEACVLQLKQLVEAVDSQKYFAQDLSRADELLVFETGSAGARQVRQTHPARRGPLGRGPAAESPQQQSPRDRKEILEARPGVCGFGGAGREQERDDREAGEPVQPGDRSGEEPGDRAEPGEPERQAGQSEAATGLHGRRPDPHRAKKRAAERKR